MKAYIFKSQYDDINAVAYDKQTAKIFAKDRNIDKRDIIKIDYDSLNQRTQDELLSRELVCYDDVYLTLDEEEYLINSIDAEFTSVMNCINNLSDLVKYIRFDNEKEVEQLYRFIKIFDNKREEYYEVGDFEDIFDMGAVARKIRDIY